MRKRLIIDTDVALGIVHKDRPRDIDDGFAIVEAINSPDIELLGISCVFGNAPLDLVHQVAAEICSLKNIQLPVKKGAAKKLRPNQDTNNAVEFLAQQLSNGPASIAAIGPLTNIALLIKKHPEVIRNIDELIMVAGRSKDRQFYIGQSGPVGDFNFECDPEAADLVMSSGINCVLMGFELTSQVTITQRDLESILIHQSEASNYFYKNSLAWLKYWTQTFSEDEGFHPWDSATIAWLINPDLFITEKRGHKIKSDPSQLECDKRYPGPKHTFCYGFSDSAKELFIDTILKEIY